MKYTECANGHVYDADQYAVCPYCNKARTEIQFAPTGDGKTVSPGGAFPGGQPQVTVAPGMGGPSAYEYQTPYGQAGGERIMPASPVENSGKTVAPDANRKQAEQTNKTVAVFQRRYGLDPVVGWLVCVEGPEKGRDFHLMAKINTIGRGEGDDVCVKGDKTISSHAHAKLAYDARNNNYKIIPGEGANINYLNNEPIYMPMDLHPYDQLDMGESQFLFIPLCNDQFRWDVKEQG